MAYDIHLEFIVPAKPEVVMQLLTDEKLLRRWSGGDAKIEKQEDGNFEMFDGWVYGKVLKITDKELAYTWKTTDWAEDIAVSEVHYKLEKDKEGTKVTLDHTGLPNEEEMNEHREGWDDQFFGLMEEYIYSMKL